MEIFCSIWERRDTLRITESWEKYFYRSAKNRYLNYSRNLTTQQKHLKEIARALPVGQNTTEETIDETQMAEEIAKLVKEMPEKRREVFQLSRQKGLSTKEIAELMEISEKTVKNHLTKSLSFLRLNLEYSPVLLLFFMRLLEK